jgi:DNA-binding NtrC family response regulator
MMVMGETIDVVDLPESLRAQAPVAATASKGPATASEPEELDKDLSLEEQERLLLVSALEKAGGNQSQAARILRISRDRMRYKMSKHHLK